MNYLTRKIESIVISILDTEIEKRVGVIVDAKLKEVFTDLSQPKEIAILKAKNLPLGAFIEFVSKPNVDITEIQLDIGGKTAIDTHVFFKHKFKEDDPLKQFTSLVTDEKVSALREKLANKGFVYYTDLDFRVRFEYMGETGSKSFAIIDVMSSNPTDFDSVAIQIKRVRDETIRVLPEYLI